MSLLTGHSLRMLLLSQMFWLTWPMLLSAQPAPGVPMTGATPSPAAEVNKGLIETRKKEISENTSLPEEVRKKVIDQYDKALEQLKLAEETQQALTALQSSRNKAKESLAEVRSRLEQLTPLTKPDTRDMTTAELQQELLEAETNQQQAIQSLAAKQKIRNFRLARATEVPQQLQTVSQALQEVERSLQTPPPPTELAEVVQANQVFLMARKKRLEAEKTALTEELPAYSATAELLATELRYAEALAAQEEEWAQFWSDVVAVRKQEERDQQLESAREMAEAADPVLKELAEQNRELARQRRGPEGLPARIVRADQDLKQLDELLRQLTEEREKTEEQLKIPGMETVIGPQLLRQHRQLPRQNYYRGTIQNRQELISRTRFEQIQARDELDALRKESDYLTGLLNQSGGDLTPQRRERIREQAQAILIARRALLEEQSSDYATLTNKLYELSTREQELINAIGQYAVILDEQILWVRSTEPVRTGLLQSAWEAGRWFLAPSQWQQVGEAFWSDLHSQPVMVPGVWLLLLALLLRRGHLARKLAECNVDVEVHPLTSISRTLEGLWLIFLKTSLVPGALLFAGWRLNRSVLHPDFVRSVGLGLMTTGVTYFFLDAARRLTRRGGLAEVHYHWRWEQIRNLTIHLRWLFILGVPAVFVMSVLENQPRQEFADSLGRLALMFTLAGLSIFLLSTLPNYLRNVGTQDRLTPWKWLVLIHAVCFPLLLIVLAASGFHYTAVELTTRLSLTLGLVFATLIFYCTGLRWLYIARGQLAMKQDQEINPLSDDEEDPGTPPDLEEDRPEEPPPPIVTQAPGHSLDTVKAHTRRFLNIVTISLFASGCWFIWASVLPALSFLDHHLWSSVQQVSQLVDGQQLPEMVTQVQVITVADVIWAFIVAGIGFVAATNLPGLLEVSLLQNLPLDSGGRYAASTIIKYILMTLGAVIALGMMGIHWGQVQWLVAALGVGLGFGMQEIFANFISGIILLFERPIRVGDIVTVDDVTGVVTRIRIRATTVRNWDRKEFIVPNKELITGRLLNWTLSDQMNRIVITINLNYGSDTEKARKIILGVVRNHKAVMTDPPPVVTFEGFGEHSLQLVVRCFVETMEVRLPTVHELHTGIHKACQRAGIPIAYPQRDLHIRSVDPAVKELLGGKPNRAVS